MLVAPPYHCGQLLAVNVGAGAVAGGSYWFPDVSCMLFSWFPHGFTKVSIPNPGGCSQPSKFYTKKLLF